MRKAGISIAFATRAQRLLQRLLVALSFTFVGVGQAMTSGPSVKDVVEFTRIVHPYHQDSDRLRQQVSPNGERAFIVTRRADVARDIAHYEVLLLDLKSAALSAGDPPGPRRLLAIDASKDDDSALPFIADPIWADNRSIVMRVRVNDAPSQVYRLDVDSGRFSQLTFHPEGVSSFAISADLKRVVYAAVIPHPPMKQGARSVVVGNNSFWSVKFGQDDVRAQIRQYGFFVTDCGSDRPALQLGGPVLDLRALPVVSISPDGRWALLPVPAPERQVAWSQEYPLVARLTANYGPAVTADPLNYFTHPAGWVPRRIVAYRLSDGQAAIPIDAPDDAQPGGGQARADRLWMNGGKSVLIAGTLLPAGVSPNGAAPDTSYVIEYWPDDGRWRIAVALKGRAQNIYPVAGAQERFAVLDGGLRRTFERAADGTWRELLGSIIEQSQGREGRAWHLIIDQALNAPPEVMAVGPGGRRLQLTHLNPNYDANTWGSMQAYRWRDGGGREWEGGLMTPARFDPKARYPLVIQTYGFDGSRFYLDGTNLSDGATSGFPGRALLRENILVLALPIGPLDGSRARDHRELVEFADAVRTAIRALVRDGTVDPSRVGIMGWSMTGEHVLNLVTYSDVPIRAATLLDGDANTLFSMSVSYAASDIMQLHLERINQGAPFGETLPAWVRNDPALHTDCIRSAMRIETYGPWVLNNWDLYALLRRQYKAAEMIVIPGGTHALAHPSERMISLQGNVDWYRFWLKDEARSEVILSGESGKTLDEQYSRWGQMRQLKARDDVNPRSESCVFPDPDRRDP